MFATLGVKTDFSLLKSLIKVEDYVSYALNNKLTCIGILDDNLSCSHLFYTLCKKNNIKPIIGLDIFIEDANLYLYPKNYNGLLNLFKITSLDNISLDDTSSYEKEKEKLYKKYEKKYSGYELDMIVKRKLYEKGYFK